jgi:amidase
VADALKGARIGVVRQLSNTETADTAVIRRFDEALEVMRRLGAVTVEPAHIPELDSLPNLWCPRFKMDIETYLQTLGEKAPVTSVEGILTSGKYHPSIEARLRSFQNFTTPAEDARCKEASENAGRLRGSVRRLLWERRLDALVFPTWSNPPRLIGDLNSPHGNNSYQLSPPLGFPAVTVPMGTVGDGLPVGLQFLGDTWTDWKLIALAYSYEQATKHRRPPASTPPLY